MVSANRSMAAWQAYHQERIPKLNKMEENLFQCPHSGPNENLSLVKTEGHFILNVSIDSNT